MSGALFPGRATKSVMSGALFPGRATKPVRLRVRDERKYNPRKL